MNVFNTRISSKHEVVYSDLTIGKDKIINTLIKGRKIHDRKLYEKILQSMSSEGLKISRDIFIRNLDDLCERGDLTTVQLTVLKDRVNKLSNQ